MSIPEAAARFAEDGYAVFAGALTAYLPVLRGACDSFVAREDARMDAAGVDSIGITHRGLRYFANECQREHPELRRILFSPAMANICRATLGADAYFFFDQFVVKGPEAGLAFAWHQDSGYVVGNGGPLGHPPYLTCWCPLDDADDTNGTLRLIPGSHRKGLRDHRRLPASNDLAVDVADPGIALSVRAGSVVVFSSLLLHATGSNLSAAPRRAYLAQYTTLPMLDPDTGHLRRNAIRLLDRGGQVTFA